MSRIVVPARTRLVYVESRGWLLGKLGLKLLVLTGVIFVWGPLVAGRPYAMRLVGWLVWAAIALLALGAVVRVGEAIWGAGCTAYVLVRSLAEAVASAASAVESGARSHARVSGQRSATQPKWVKNGSRGGSGT
jgi:type IV secretory pathway TrbL component